MHLEEVGPNSMTSVLIREEGEGDMQMGQRLEGRVYKPGSPKGGSATMVQERCLEQDPGHEHSL